MQNLFRGDNDYLKTRKELAHACTVDSSCQMKRGRTDHFVQELAHVLCNTAFGHICKHARLVSNAGCSSRTAYGRVGGGAY